MLSYLNDFKKYCDFDGLLQLKRQKLKFYQYKNAIEQLSAKKNFTSIKANTMNLCTAEISVGCSEDLTLKTQESLKENIEDLIPWKKGPFKLFGIEIDAEWRSDLKWKRISPHLRNIKGKRVLDIGCNNGYFMFKMAELNPQLILGIDPVISNQIQFDFIQKYLNLENLKFELFGVEDLHLFNGLFDTILSMGIIYHHRHPLQQLKDIHQALNSGGELILETIGIPGVDSTALFPEDRYAKMKNVWFVPTLSCLINWTKRAHFVNIEVISDTPLDNTEQRLTKYCPPPFQSLDDFLDPQDASKTIEGYPAPRRFCIKASKK